jgi:hypothetical protein
VTATDAGLMPLVTQLGRARASVMDVPVVLASLCSTMPGMLGVAGAVILMTEPAQSGRPPAASDARACRIGEIQQRMGSGPLVAVLHNGRPVLTPDLKRAGLPALAAAAAETGFASSLVRPVEVDGDQVGALQLLGDPQRPVEAALSDILRPLLEVLAARLGDFIALNRARTARRPSPAMPESPSPARPAVSVEQAVPAQRVVQSGPIPPLNGAPETAPPRRRSRSRDSGAHSAAAAADPLNSTTRALPAVPADPRKPSTPRSQADRPRSGRHSA